GFPSDATFKRLGSKRQRVSKILAFCHEHGGHEDVIAICHEVTIRDDPEECGSSSTLGEFGFVYLLKSGRFHKIGRSNAAGRRERELAIQLPEKAEIVHSIRTDDPPGIEAYWHKRFEEKRKNGEWFQLDAADVKAFRRRKFM
ncbi:MAG: GIY-YIG nuclease family protein, partial [Planctomycetota bacterium]|nr:GIY-YIG nuclease family protein [Planctomycetota bacterium]